MSDESGKGGIERRVHERVDANLGVSWVHITDEQAEQMLTSGDFIELFSLMGLEVASSEEAMERKAYTENLSMSGIKLTGDLRLSTGEPLQDGWQLAVTLDVPGAPLAVRALAVIVWTTPLKGDQMSAGLFFEGIHKGDSEKVAQYIGQKAQEKERASGA